LVLVFGTAALATFSATEIRNGFCVAAVSIVLIAIVRWISHRRAARNSRRDPSLCRPLAHEEWRRARAKLGKQ